MKTIFPLYQSPVLSTVEGKFGLFTESGKCWLKAESVVDVVDLAALADVAGRLPFEEIAGIELDAGFGRIDFEDPP